MTDTPDFRSIILFFSRGVSLHDWAEAGNLGREVAIYLQLQRLGANVAFITYGGKTDLSHSDEIPGIDILCNKWRLPLPIYEKLIPILHSGWLRRTGIIKTNQTNGGVAALRSARFWKIPLIARCGYMWSDFTARQYGNDSKEATHALNVESILFSAAQQVVVTTEAMKNDIVQRLGRSQDSITVIPNYVDTDQFSPSDDMRSNTKKIIFIGRLEAQKNVQALLEAVSEIEAELIMIGSGSLKNELYNKYGTLSGRVQWVDNVPHSELPGYLNSASVFILPSLYEGHPKTMIEAMSCGVPVIGADSPGIREIIRHGENGLLCGIDPESIRSALNKLLLDKDLRAKLGASARKYAKDNYALDTIADKELSLYRSIAPL